MKIKYLHFFFFVFITISYLSYTQANEFTIFLSNNNQKHLKGIKATKNTLIYTDFFKTLPPEPGLQIIQLSNSSQELASCSVSEFSDLNPNLDIPFTSSDYNKDYKEIIFNPDLTDTEVFINEFHYSDVGPDDDEFIEIAIANSATVTLSDLTVSLYNGNNGQTYNQETLDNFTVGMDDGTFTYFTWMPSNIQNSTDGFSLDCDGTLIQFLSYEGTFMAENGPANGSNSSDVGVFEPGSTLEGSSVQLIDGVWTLTSGFNTLGATNSATVCPTVIEAFINEFHYDNTGGDVNEFIEIAIANSASVTLSDLTVSLYNGSNGETYNQETLDNFTVGIDDGTFTYFTWMPASIQNGGPDGFSLDCEGTLIQFLSYEGDFTAINGPASGSTSSETDVSQPGSTPEGSSIQLIDGVWTLTSGFNTLGATNSVTACPTVIEAFINEFHYSDVGPDDDEFIEIAIANSASVTLSDLTVSLYNGNNGQTYNQETLDNFTVGIDDGTFTYFTWMPSNIQNSTDGFSLDCNGTLIQFLSYEGTFMAENGPANGSTSTDVGVFEPGSTLEGSSVQLIDGVWTLTSGFNTLGATNSATVCPTVMEVFINEFHYDNTGGDANEFIEIAIANSASVTLSDLTVSLYNGSNGETYNQETLDNFTVGIDDGTFTYFTWMPASIQNGGPDGFSLDCEGTLIQFLSYEGDFMAENGPANGSTSSDVGVDEPGSTPEGSSIQLIDGTWTLTSEFNTLGETNALPSCPDLSVAPPNATVVNRSCNPGCIIQEGTITAPEGTPCPDGSLLQYSVNGSIFLSTVPDYNQTTPITITTRCNCVSDNTMNSPVSDPIITNPTNCETPIINLSVSLPTCNSPGSIFLSGPGISYSVSINGGAFLPTSSTIVIPAGEQMLSTYVIATINADECTNMEQVDIPAVIDCIPDTPLILLCRHPTSTVTDEGVCGKQGLGLLPPFIIEEGAGSVVITNDVPDIFPVGITEVLWTATDAADNTATCTSLVFITDNEAPIIESCNTSIAYATVGCNAQVVINPTFSDNCGITSIVGTGVFTYPVGTFVHPVTASDGVNETTHYVTVMVHDNAKPTSVVCPDDVIVLNGNNVNLPEPIFVDNCEVFSVNNDAPSVFPEGETLVTWEAMDFYGNVGTCTYTVTLNEVNPLVDSMNYNEGSLHRNNETNIGNYPLRELSLSPNPASTYLIASYKLAVGESGKISIFDITGRVVKELQVDSIETNISIDINDFGNGMFLVRLLSDTGERLTRKLIVQH